MAQEKEPFVSRWSRLKQEQAQEKPAAPVAKKDDAPPALPPAETLTPESDFSGFMHPKVGDALRRAALKKLFGDPHFNVPDPFEAYSGDWTGGDAISAEMLEKLAKARSVLLEAAEKKDRKEEPPAAEEKPKEDDGAGRQDA